MPTGMCPSGCSIKAPQGTQMTSLSQGRPGLLEFAFSLLAPALSSSTAWFLCLPPFGGSGPCYPPLLPLSIPTHVYKLQETRSGGMD